MEYLGDLHNSYELEAILNLINTDDEDLLFITCVDSSRSSNLSTRSQNSKKQLLSKAEDILSNAASLEKHALEKLIIKLN